MHRQHLKIWILSAAFIVVVAVVSVFALVRSYNSIIEIAYTKADFSGYLVSEWIAESFKNIEYILKDSLYGLDSSKVYSKNNDYEYFQQVNQRLTYKDDVHKNIIFLGIFDPECTIQYGSVASIIGDSSKDLGRAYCQEVMEPPLDQLKISSFFISSTGEMNVSATYPLLSKDNEVLGFSLAGLNLSFFQRWLDSIDDPYVTISIMDSNQTLLARKPLTGGLGKRVNDKALEEFIQSDAMSTLARVKSPVDGIDRLWTIRKIGDLPFVLAVGYALNDVLMPWRTELFSYIIGNVLLALSIIFLAKSYYRNILDTHKLKQLATYDQLTGLMNRRSFEDIVKSKIQRILAYNGDSSIILIDIDHFKAVNDSHGHETGDEVLKEVAGVIHSSFRSSDVTARWGGEEFIVFLSDTDAETARLMADRLKQNIETKRYHKNLNITVSQGVSSLTQDDAYESLLKKADKMLYKAKNSGRNCVC